MTTAMIVEPHFDDAWINLGGFMLLHPDWHFKIVTLSDYPTNCINGAATLGNYLPHLSHKFLGYSSLGFDDCNMKALQRQHSETEPLKLFMKMNRLSTLNQIKDAMIQQANGMDIVFWPFGLKHPQHIVMSRLNPFSEFTFYREFPYYFYSDQECEIRKRIGDMRCTRVLIGNVLKKKIHVLREAYPSQGFVCELYIEGINICGLEEEVLWDYGHIRMLR